MKEIVRLSLPERRTLAEQVLGGSIDAQGFGPCPGKASHSTRNGRKDFVVYLDKKVSCTCVHASCQAACDTFIEQLRDAIWQMERHLTYGDETDADYKKRQAVMAEKRKYETPPPPTAPPVPKHLPPKSKVDLPFVKVDAAFLRSRSPVWVDNAGSFLASLYLPNEKVLVFTNFYSQGDYLYWNGHGSYQLSQDVGVRANRVDALPTHANKGIWFLSNPVSGKWQAKKSVNQETGEIEMTRRSEPNFVRWPYMVLESDEIETREWLSRVVQMPIPIVAIYTSGRRSVHCLVRINAPCKSEYDKVLNERGIGAGLSLYGADHKAMNAIRLTRLPFCQHRNFKPEHKQEGVQRLLYLNPNATGEPISQLPPMLGL